MPVAGKAVHSVRTNLKDVCVFGGHFGGLGDLLVVEEGGDDGDGEVDVLVARLAREHARWR
jgi:hypothetical protein